MPAVSAAARLQLVQLDQIAPIGRTVMLYSLYVSINGLSNTKIFFEFEPVVPEISVFNQPKKHTNSSAL